jgi:chaperone BCS1
MWKESVFDSTRTFKNLFFDQSEAIIGKVDFFLKNRDWYYEKGIPYTLGIGLYGPPGTGKTSFIKALANHTGRHIVSISLKMVKTKGQLEDVFFETRYNTDNKKKSVGFDKKIIVFEDIDCIGDIVMDREKKKEIKKQELPLTVEQSKDALKVLLEPDDAITLDDILELWDGIREASGRIMIVTSNHYDKLDPALRRPGRIDITLELAYATREVIGRMYRYLVGEEADADDLAQIKDRFYTPAEIMNVYMNERRGMLKRLLKNEKV